jgi:hypothetical protein
MLFSSRAERILLTKSSSNPEAFWSETLLSFLRTAQRRLNTSPDDNELLRIIRERDGLEWDTLERFGCGLVLDREIAEVSSWGDEGRDWLLIPYPTGAQLYRRHSVKDPKIIKHLPGSRPSESFFGEGRLLGQRTMVLAKSPREAMLVWQSIDGVDVLALSSGETARLTERQIAHLRQVSSDTDLVRVAMDCDTDKAGEVARQLSRCVANFVSPAPTELVDVWSHSHGACKDLTDVWQAQREDGVLKAITIGKRIRRPIESSSATTLPATFYSVLHPDLREACNHLNQGYERDVFAMGLLPCLSACLPNVVTRYGRRLKALPLMTAIVAPAGSGKGTLSLAAETVREIDEHLRQESEHRLAFWKALDDKEKKAEDKPPFERLRIGADSSLRALTDALADNDGRGLIFETEIKVMASSLKQEWGDFKGLLLKAAEQEPYERERKDGGAVHIPRPELAVAMSGTPRSFVDWMKDAEDGLYSRFLFYTFEAPPTWRSQFSDESDDELDHRLSRIAGRNRNMYFELRHRPVDDEGRTRPLILQLHKASQGLIDDAFGEMLSQVDEQGRPELFASVKRGAFQTVRIAGALAAYRLAAEGIDLSERPKYSPEVEEVQAAIDLVQCLLCHAARLAESFRDDPVAMLESEERRQFYEALPEVFTTAEAVKIGDAVGLTYKKKVQRALFAMLEVGLLVREARGLYQKCHSV